MLLPGRFFVKEDRRTDEDARKDQSSERTNVRDSAGVTGENGDVGGGKAATFQHFSQHRFFVFFSDPGEILFEANANPADSDAAYLS